MLDNYAHVPMSADDAAGEIEIRILGTKSSGSKATTKQVTTPSAKRQPVKSRASNMDMLPSAELSFVPPRVGKKTQK